MNNDGRDTFYGQYFVNYLTLRGQKFWCKLYFFYKKIYYFHSSVEAQLVMWDPYFL